MSRFILQCSLAVLLASVAFAQQPSGTSPTPAPGTHMEQSTTQTVGTQNSAAGATPVPATPAAGDSRVPPAPAPAATSPSNSPAPTNASPAPAPATTKDGSGVAPAATEAAPTVPASAPEPVTKTFSGAGGTADPNDVGDLLSPKPLSNSRLSLIGGTVRSVDQIRDHMTLKIYGAGTMKVRFDQRTHFYRDGRETTQLALKKGDRIYLDSQLNQGSVFAKNVHIATSTNPADANGQIVSFDPRSGDMLVRDDLSGSPVQFRLAPNSTIRNGSTVGNRSDLRPGALIAVRFSPKSGGHSIADEVSIIAEPGTSFTYFGRVTHLDLHSGLLAVENRSDGKTYEVHFNNSGVQVPQDLTVGSEVTIQATFTGKTYDAQSIVVNAAAAQAKLSDGQNGAAGDLADDSQQSFSGDSNDQKASKGKHQKGKKSSSGSNKNDSDR